MKTLFQKCFGGMASILRAQVQRRALGANMVMAGLSHCQFHLSYSNLQSHKVSGFCQAQCVLISLSLFRMRHSLACDHFPMQGDYWFYCKTWLEVSSFLKLFCMACVEIFYVFSWQFMVSFVACFSTSISISSVRYCFPDMFYDFDLHYNGKHIEFSLKINWHWWLEWQWLFQYIFKENISSWLIMSLWTS